MALFRKTNKEEKKPAKVKPAVKEQEKETSGQDSTAKFLPTSHGILKGFYVSEKATGLASSNQYVFRVFDNATKNEVKKQVERSFEVKVKGVKMTNLPRKKRTIGRHAGFKAGLKKAVVVLEKGYTIEQAKA